jgi:hypothetical protein
MSSISKTLKIAKDWIFRKFVAKFKEKKAAKRRALGLEGQKQGL